MYEWWIIFSYHHPCKLIVYFPLEILNIFLRVVIYVWISESDSITPLSLSDGETITNLAVESSRKAIEMAKVEAKDIDLVLLCTSTPDDLFSSGPQVCFLWLFTFVDESHNLIILIFTIMARFKENQGVLML